MVIFVRQFSMNCHDNSKNKNRKIDFSLISALRASSIKNRIKTEGCGVCISLGGKKPQTCLLPNIKPLCRQVPSRFTRKCQTCLPPNGKPVCHQMSNLFAGKWQNSLLPNVSIEPFDLYFDLHLFLQAATVSG